MDLRRGLMVQIILLAGFLVPFTSAKAEELTIYGLPFEIDEIEQVGESTVRLTLNGKAFLVPAEQVPYYVLKEAQDLGSLKERTVEQLRLLLDGAVAERDLQSLEIILPLIVLRPEASANEVERIFKNLKTIDTNHEIFDRFWASHSAQLTSDLQARLILSIVEDGTSSVVSIVPGSELDKKIGELIEERLKSLLEQGLDCTPMAKGLAQSFDPNNERSALIIEACDSGLAAQKASTTLDTAALLNIFKGTKSELSKNIVEPSLVKALHSKAEAEISEKRFGEALSILGDIPQHKISPTTHDLILKSLQGIQDPLKDNLVSGSIEVILLHVVERSPQVKKAYVSALNRSAQEGVTLRDWTRVDKALELISRYEEDSIVKDNIWYEVAVSSAKLGELEKANLYFNSQSQKPGFSKKLGFYLQGGYGMRYLLLLLPIFVFIAIKRWKAHLLSKQGQEFADVAINLSGVSEEPQSRLTPDENRELNKSLYRLGLKPRASEQDIKNAFRERAKKIHPDKHNNEDSDSSNDEFVELTKAYDLALKLTQKQLEA